MKRELWLERCTAQFRKRGGLEETAAREAAIATADAFLDDEQGWGGEPEAAADEEMRHWDNDESSEKAAA